VFAPLKGVALPDVRKNNMSTVKEIKKAFHESRIAGEKLLSQGKISWDEYAFSMVGFELALRELGDDL
jgi:hypothetical protein